jgi:acyl-CoA thioester hydrolase
VEQHADDRSVFRWRVRVYYEDTDAGGLVYYANYLKFFERCRTEWLRALGVSQLPLARDERLKFVVTELEVRYRKPALLDDELVVEAELAGHGRSFLDFRQLARRGEEPLATARVKVACIDSARLAPVRLPKSLLERLPSGRAAP